MEAFKYFDLTIPACSFLYFRNTLGPLQANSVRTRGFIEAESLFRADSLSAGEEIPSYYETENLMIVFTRSYFWTLLSAKQFSPHPQRFQINYNIISHFSRREQYSYL
jgi:hypothetical protein